MRKSGLALLALVALASCTGSEGSPDVVGAAAADRAVVPAAYPEQVYWGDTHLHTSNSLDAFSFGNRLGPEEALRFAMGERVESSTGISAQLARPLDFLVIADHSDSLGSMRRLYEMPRESVTDPVLRRWQDLMKQGPRQSQQIIADMMARAAKGGFRRLMPISAAKRRRAASGPIILPSSIATTGRAGSPP